MDRSQPLTPLPAIEAERLARWLVQIAHHPIDELLDQLVVIWQTALNT
jgi:hypothetical protein